MQTFALNFNYLLRKRLHHDISLFLLWQPLLKE